MEEQKENLEERLDKVLIQRGLVSTRVRAEEIIRQYGVMVNGKMINKTGKRIPLDATVELLAEESPYVSRGATKLVHALTQFQINPEGKVALDIGASTGGFTEVLLENKVAKVYCVDVGTKQLHEKIKANDKVVNLEKTHVRELNKRLIPEMCQLVVIDVSFISLSKVFPFIHSFVEAGAPIVALIKPQFEVGKENIGKGGIVKNKMLYPQVINDIKATALLNHFEYQAHVDSPILGGDGNQEFLAWFKKVE